MLLLSLLLLLCTAHAFDFALGPKGKEDYVVVMHQQTRAQMRKALVTLGYEFTSQWFHTSVIVQDYARLKFLGRHAHQKLHASMFNLSLVICCLVQ